MPSLVISRLAERDLTTLIEWLAETAGARVAKDVAGRIERTFDLLSASPQIGRRRDDLIGAPRTFSVRPWTVFYQPLPDREGVLILRVVDGGRDLPNL